MDRRSRLRVEKCEELLSAAQQEHDDRLKQLQQVAPTHARRHATAVAAIVLAGHPRIDDPLRLAWARALQHYGVGSKDQVAASQLLRPKIIGDGEESTRFTEIFRTAPAWLLHFTAMAMDARLLKFDLPSNISDTLKWGSAGYEDARRWPLLPMGTITAGDPIPASDPRRLWIILACEITEPIPNVDDFNQKDEEVRSRCERDDPLIRDMFLALDLDGKPESKWSAYERRRMRKLSKWMGL